MTTPNNKNKRQTAQMHMTFDLSKIFNNALLTVCNKFNLSSDYLLFQLNLSNNDL